MQHGPSEGSEQSHPDWPASREGLHQAAQPWLASIGRDRSRLQSCACLRDRRFRSRYSLETASAIRTQTDPRGAARGARHSDARCFQGQRGFRGGGLQAQAQTQSTCGVPAVQVLRRLTALVHSRRPHRCSFVRNRTEVLSFLTGHRPAWRARSLQRTQAQSEAPQGRRVA